MGNPGNQFIPESDEETGREPPFRSSSPYHRNTAP
jgi:hypothetical protein